MRTWFKSNLGDALLAGENLGRDGQAE